MNVTRREFVLVTTAAVASLALPASGHSAVEVNGRDGAVLLAGDPWLATVPDGGLGGESFASARQRALRFRTPASLRDRYVLGLEWG